MGFLSRFLRWFIFQQWWRSCVFYIFTIFSFVSFINHSKQEGSTIKPTCLSSSMNLHQHHCRLSFMGFFRYALLKLSWKLRNQINKQSKKYFTKGLNIVIFPFIAYWNLLKCEYLSTFIFEFIVILLCSKGVCLKEISKCFKIFSLCARFCFLMLSIKTASLVTFSLHD